MEKPIVKIEDWQILYLSNNNCLQLVGMALNHPLLGTQFIYSSKIVEIDGTSMTVETLNTLYELVCH